MSDCENFIHEWVDHYYGVECKNCKLLVPMGLGSWMPDAKETETPASALANQVIDDKGKHAKLNDAARAQGQAGLKGKGHEQANTR